MNIIQITLRGETLYQHAHQILIHLLREAHLNTCVQPPACLIVFISYCARLISNMYGGEGRGR